MHTPSEGVQEPGSPPELRRRRRRSVLATASLAALTIAATVGSPVSAAPQSAIAATTISSGLEDLGSFTVNYFEPSTVTWLYVTVETSVEYNGTLTSTVEWDSDKVRQGAGLVVGSNSPLALGEFDVTWTVTGSVAPFNNAWGEIDLGTSTMTDSASCAPNLDIADSSYTCFADAPFWTVLPGFGPGTPYVKLAITTSFEVTPEGAHAVSAVRIGGEPVHGPFPALVTADGFVTGLNVPCTASPGDPVELALTDLSWTPDVDAHQHVSAQIGMMDPSGFVELPGIGVGIGDWDLNPTFDVEGDGFVVPLGDLKANGSHPEIDPLGTFSGDEGSPIAFAANVDSVCGLGSYLWEFSNGTTSFGPAPQRSFDDDGTYDGQVTVTDVTGLSSTRSFSVDVSNLAPAANAGPDTYADWGRLLQFNGQATDPGAGDQATLQHEWWFGDGTPIATGGASVLHAYSMPGSYTATYTACDKDGACSDDTRTITVTKRDTTLGYTGPLKAKASKVVTLTAHLEDEYGQPVAGRKVTFSLGSQQVVGTTDGSGNVTVSLKLAQKPGSYALAVVFPAGDARYYDSVDAGMTFVIGK